MLKLAGETGTGRENIELLTYNPGVQDTGDLEAATKTITATSEASGLANADYSQALTLPKPDDARLIVKRIVSRLAVTIDSFDTATILYCRVYVDAQDAGHRLFDMNWNSTGSKLAAVEKTSGTIFSLLSDGVAHTFYFFFWVNQANNAVISVVQLWEGVGGKVVREACLHFTGVGELQIAYMTSKQGTGTIYHWLAFDVDNCPDTGIWQATNLLAADGKPVNLLCHGKAAFAIWSSVDTDLPYIGKFSLMFRSEQ